MTSVCQTVSRFDQDRRANRAMGRFSARTGSDGCASVPRRLDQQRDRIRRRPDAAPDRRDLDIGVMYTPSHAGD